MQGHAAHDRGHALQTESVMLAPLYFPKHVCRPNPTATEHIHPTNDDSHYLVHLERSSLPNACINSSKTETNGRLVPQILMGSARHSFSALCTNKVKVEQRQRHLYRPAISLAGMKPVPFIEDSQQTSTQNGLYPTT